MTPLARVLVVAALAWPAILGAAVWARATGHGGGLMYIACGFICHQRPERSFATAGVAWPVCARCSGIYAGAAIGAAAAAALARRRRRAGVIALLAAAALPSLAIWLVEILNVAPVSSLARAVAALPLGGALAWVIVGAANERHRVH